MDTCVNENDVDMDLLVDNNPDPREDYVEEHNKEVVEQNPDPDKVVESDLEMDPAAATEAFIRKNFGLSIEELDEEAEEMEASAEEIVENSEPVTDEDSLLGIEPAAPESTTVVVNPPEGGDTEVVAENTVVDGETPEESTVTTLEVEPETAADVASLENLRAIFSREDEDVDGTDADVSLNVQTPNNDVDIDLEGKAVTIEPNDDGAATDSTSDAATPDTESNSVEAPETSDDADKEPEATNDESDKDEKEDTDSSAESWWMI